MSATPTSAPHAEAPAPVALETVHIDGKWLPAASGATREVLDPADATVDALVEMYRDVQGEHPDWDDFRAAMVNDQRLVVSLPVGRAYGMA